ncbi:MAG: hypothetical protein ACP5Q4_09020, partial [Candidatus Caldatribacteriaceae bacterium]
MIQLYKRSAGEKGKGGSHRLRKSGWIPAVLYSKDSRGGVAELVKLQAKEFEKILYTRHASHHLLFFSLEGRETRGIIK